MKIILLSDTHGFIDSAILNYVKECDEVWHAGDFGTMEVSEKLSAVKKLRGVYGNVDGQKLREIHPLHNRFSCEGFTIWMTHIGGYPGNYDPKIKKLISENPPDIFITGHSHILKIMRYKNLNNLLHINPGAAGKEGMHKVRTLVKFELKNKTIENVMVIELGSR